MTTVIATACFTILGTLAVAAAIHAVVRSAGAREGFVFAAVALAFAGLALSLLAVVGPVAVGLGLALIGSLTVIMIAGIFLVQPLYVLVHAIPPLQRRADARMLAQGYRRHPAGGWIRESGPWPPI